MRRRHASGRAQPGSLLRHPNRHPNHASTLANAISTCHYVTTDHLDDIKASASQYQTLHFQTPFIWYLSSTHYYTIRGVHVAS
eukprot:scaffold57440_cov39-Prasinocladus_malaysianus.AAC.2